MRIRNVLFFITLSACFLSSQTVWAQGKATQKPFSLNRRLAVSSSSEEKSKAPFVPAAEISADADSKHKDFVSEKFSASSLPKDTSLEKNNQVLLAGPKMLYEDKVFESTEKLNIDPATGTASMSAAFHVPAGRAGIQPTVALSYSSGSQNGLAGMGWSLDLGKIARSTKRGAPTYTNNDKFVLLQNKSQQELVDISGNATEFRPEIDESFMKIEFLNNTYWRVTDRKGIKYYFGQTNSSRTADPNNASRVLEWHLDRVEDITGNYMVISYIKDENQVYPEKIEYTGNVPSNLSPFAKVEFIWESRPDITFSYRSKFYIGTKKRLSLVNVYAENILQRKYKIDYTQSPATQRSLLTSIVQYGADGTSTLPVTTFGYQQSQKGFVTASGWNIPASARFSEYQLNGRQADLGVRIADVNSDGYPDIVKHHMYHWGSPTRETFLHDGNQSWVASPSNWKLPANLTEFIMTAGEIDWGFGVVMADINGDARVDIVRHFKNHPPEGAGTIYNEAYLNNGTSGWASSANWPLPNGGPNGSPSNNEYDLPIQWHLGYPVYSYHEYTGNIFDDVNGDGYADYVKSKEDGWGPQHFHKTFINNLPQGSGWTHNSTWDTPAVYYTDFAHGATMIDLNGDGLNDIMYSKDNVQKVYINNGAGWTEDASSPWINTFNETNFNNGTTQAVDLNGDGLLDLAITKDDGSRKVLINNGNGWTSDNSWNLPGTLNLKSFAVKFADANADGMVDVLEHFNGNTPVVYLNKGQVPDLLVLMDNGIGGQRTIEYDSACHYQNTFFPFPASVVKRMVVHDGLGSSYTTEYSYADGYWDADKRESRGFGEVKTIDPDGNYTKAYFLQDDIYKGRPSRQETYDANGNLYSKTVNIWNNVQLSPGVYFPYLAQTDNFIYDGNATGRRTQEKYFYAESPQYGNPTKTIQMGEVNLATGSDIGSDTRTVETTYHNNTSGNNWLLGIPKQVTVKNNAGVEVRKTWFYYDGNTNLNTLPIKGQMTKKELWGGNGLGAVNPVTKYTYDVYGNLLTTEDPNGHVSTVTYDGTYHMFPLTAANAKNHSVIKEYYGVNGIPLDDGAGFRGLWGQVKSVKDPNSQQGKKTYDTFGRLAATVSPLDSAAFPTSSVEYAFLSNGVKVVTHQREVHGQAGTIDSTSFYDGMGRLIQNKSESGHQGQFVVSGQTEYNSRGLPVKKYVSFFSSFPVDTLEPINQTRPHTTITYDAMGRTIQTTNPDGSFLNVIYDDWTTTSFDANGHKQASDSDAYGRLVERREYYGADGRDSHYSAQPYTLYATTKYFYDSEGSLTQVKDAHNNVTTIMYDNLGRKTAMDDPDMGHWEYNYDPAGNLIWQKDAKGQEIDFSYDVINRLTNKADGASLDVDYFYDATGISPQPIPVPVSLLTPENFDPNNSGTSILKDLQQPIPLPIINLNYGIGRLTTARYGTGDQANFFYDVLGREKTSFKKIDGTNYTVHRAYDAANRLTKLTYPGGANIFYTYNAAGQIDGVGGSASGNFLSAKEEPNIVQSAAKQEIQKDFSHQLRKEYGGLIPSFQNSSLNFKDLKNNKDFGQPKNGGTVGISVNPVQPIQGVQQNYTIDLSWSTNFSPGQCKLFVILLEADTPPNGLWSGAHDWTSLPAGPWDAENIDITTNSGSVTIVKNLEAYSVLFGYPIANYVWRAELRLVNPGMTYDPNNNGTYYLVDRKEIFTTPDVTPQMSFSATPQDPHPAVLANYNFNASWANLPIGLGNDYRLFYTLVENDTGNYYGAAYDPATSSTWQGGNVDISDVNSAGSYNASKELIAFNQINGSPIASYKWVAQIRRVASGQTYDPANPQTFVMVQEKTVTVSPGAGLGVSLGMNYYRPIVGYQKQYQLQFSWNDPIPTFNDPQYDYKYYVTLLDADSNYLAATTTGGQGWFEMGNISQPAPNTISITKNLTVNNNDGSAPNTDKFKWIGEIRRYPQGGTTTYDVLASVCDTVDGKILGAQIYVNHVEYNAAGQITRIEYGNGTTTTYAYNANTFRLANMTTVNAQGQQIQNFSYTYDGVGNILAITDAVNTGTQAFCYDALNRLVQAQGNYGTKTYAYDEIGNILSKEGVNYSYSQIGAGPHAVTSLSDGTTFTYDANGNMSTMQKSGQTWQYFYDIENRLNEVKKNNIAIAKFEYDGDGGRVKKTVYVSAMISSQGAFSKNGAKLFDPSEHLGQKDLPVLQFPQFAVTTRYIGSLYEKDGNTGISYIYLGSTRVAQISNGQVRYYHADHLGGANVLTDSTGAVKEICEYLPFGGFARHDKYGSAQEVAHFYFNGKELDDKTGLYYYGARYYNPLIGRFLTPDTIVQDPGGTPQTLNRYTYCNNNPVNLIDPTGHFWFIPAIIGAIKAAISAAAAYVVTNAAAIATGALIGGAVGGISSVAMGGDFWQGAGIGALGGAVFAGLSPGLNILGQNLARGISLGGAAGPLTYETVMITNFTTAFFSGAAAGAAVGAASGADIGNSALMGGAIAGGFSLLADTSYLLRMKEIQKCQRDPTGQNLTGKSAGIRGDGVKIAGDRNNPFKENARPSPLGGHQGEQGKVFGLNYPSGGIIDHVFESWAGPHDWLNGWTYDSIGQLRKLNFLESSVNTFTNPLNVVIATPLAVPLAVEPIGYSAPVIIYGESQR